MMIYQQDTFKLDAERITEETHPTFGPMTVFHDVVIASEIVQKYNDGKAFKSRDELKSYAWSVDGAWIIAGSHPVDGIISERDQVSGRTVNPRYVKNLKDPATDRPSRAGVLADVQVFNKRITPSLLDEMKDGTKQDVSIGFFFSKDETAGVVTDGPFKDSEYDYVQRDMFHNHLAVGIDNGRCAMPYCGLGADEVIRKAIGDPFAGFTDFDACVAKMTKPKSEGGEGYDEDTAKRICGELKSEHEDTLLEESILGKSKEHLLLLLEEAYEELRGTVLARKETAAGDWWRRINWVTARDKDDVLIYDSLPEDTKTLIIEARLCPTCEEDAPRSEAERAMSHFDLSEEEWKTLSDEEKQEYINKLPERGSGGSEDGDDPDTEDTEEGNAEGKCSEGMEWNAEKERCVKIEDDPEEAEDTKTKLDPYEVLKRANAVL